MAVVSQAREVTAGVTAEVEKATSLMITLKEMNDLDFP